jgi:hypothetical protein
MRADRAGARCRSVPLAALQQRHQRRHRPPGAWFPLKAEASAGIESTSCRTGKEPLGAAASGIVVPPAATPPLLNARNVAEGAAPPSRQADDHVRGKRSPHGGVVARSLAVESAHRGGTLVQRRSACERRLSRAGGCRAACALPMHASWAHAARRDLRLAKPREAPGVLRRRCLPSYARNPVKRRAPCCGGKAGPRADTAPAVNCRRHDSCEIWRVSGLAGICASRPASVSAR